MSYICEIVNVAVPGKRGVVGMKQQNNFYRDLAENSKIMDNYNWNGSYIGVAALGSVLLALFE